MFASELFQLLCLTKQLFDLTCSASMASSCIQIDLIQLFQSLPNRLRLLWRQSSCQLSCWTIWVIGYADSCGTFFCYLTALLRVISVLNTICPHMVVRLTDSSNLYSAYRMDNSLRGTILLDDCLEPCIVLLYILYLWFPFCSSASTIYDIFLTK